MLQRKQMSTNYPPVWKTLQVFKLLFEGLSLLPSMAALEESRTCANMEALLDSLLQSEPDLGDPLGYRLAWGKLKVDQYPIMTTKQVDAFRRDGAVLLSFGESRIIQDDTLRVTPSTRQTGNVGLNTVADYILLAVAKQVVQLMPAVVCDVQSFEELYDGRLITDP